MEYREAWWSTRRGALRSARTWVRTATRRRRARRRPLARTTETAGSAATGPRTATVNLPFVTAQFRAPNVHLPSRQEIGAAAQGLASFLPSPKAALYFGGLIGAAALEVIEWPVAVAIGVGAALASRGEARPGPWGGTRPVAQTPVERGTTTA